MKKHECFKVIRDAVLAEFALKPNDGHSVGIYSVYDVEREIYNPPFSSDDLSALHVFSNACIANEELVIGLHKVGEFNTDTGSVTVTDSIICYSDWIHDIIKENGGIEE